MKKAAFALFIVILLTLSMVSPGLPVARAEVGDINPLNHMDALRVLGQPGFISATLATSQSGMSYAHAVTIDPETGKVFVADQGNNRVLRFGSIWDLANGELAEIVLGQPDFTSNAVNRGGAANANSMYSPLGISIDPIGRLWVADFRQQPRPAF